MVVSHSVNDYKSHCLTSVHRGFRLYRLVALSRILSAQASGPPALRVKQEALLLTAACVWLINSLHARPEDGPAARNLMKAVLPLTDSDDTEDQGKEEDEEDEEDEDGDEEDTSASVPYNPYGVIFLRRVVLRGENHVPRMRVGGPFLSPPAFKFFFRTSEDEIRHKYYKIGIVPREVVDKRRVATNKMRRTTTYISFSDEPEPNLFQLADKGHRLPPPPVDDGSDIEMEGGPEITGDIDAEVSHMWRQFLIDVAMKSPSPRGSTTSSYLTISRQDRLMVGEDLYKNLKLSDMWTACQYKLAGTEQLQLAFHHLFPPYGQEISEKNVQNYVQCSYYRKWGEIRATADESVVVAIRKELFKKLRALVWIPHAVQDRIWPTTTVLGFTRLPPGTTGPAPRILIQRRPRWEVDQPSG
jgi:hypothetical protein